MINNKMTNSLPVDLTEPCAKNFKRELTFGLLWELRFRKRKTECSKMHSYAKIATQKSEQAL